jgi:Tol biopolymer transport system component
MPGLRAEITNTIRRLSRRSGRLRELDETVVATDLREGRHYGNYRVLRRLGAGGMGHVYLAIDTRLGRHAALKFLSPKLKSDPETLLRLQQEARTASSLNHPNILTIYDIDEAEGEPFIASEFIDGYTLRQALEYGPLTAGSALDYAVQVAAALKAAHEAGVIHRDLKPGNVMLRPDGLVKVIDFGLAKFTPQGHMSPSYEPVSDPGSVAGTVQYMSPEQARGEELDQRTDLWSLGVMLYEMLSHRKPFDGETESHVIVAILDQRPAELRLAAGAPAGLTRVVDKALSKSADKRYQSAQEMLEALRALEVSSQSRPSRILAAAGFAKRRKLRLRLKVAGFVCLLAGCAAVWWWRLHGAETVLGPAWFVPLNYTQVTHTGDIDLAALSPDGKQVAYTSARNGQNRLHLLHLDSGKEFTWQPYQGETLGITFSVDSATVFCTVHDQSEWGRLYSAKENSADLIFVLDDVDGPVSFSPDGTEFAFRRRSDDKRTNTESVVVVRTSDTADQRTILSKYNRAVGYRIAWSASGVMAINVPHRGLEGEDRPAVLLFTSDGKEREEYSAGRLRKLSGPAWLDSGSMLIFAGFAAGSDYTQGSIVELATHSRQFRLLPSPSLTENSLTAALNFEQVAAVTSSRKSDLWVAHAAADKIDGAEKWEAGDSFDSLAWDSNDSIVHPSPRAGSVSLWRVKRNVQSALPHGDDCIGSQPAAVPGKPILVFASNCAANPNASNLWVLNERDGKLAKLTDHSHSDHKPAVAADGDTVIYDSWPDNYPALMKISLRTHSKEQFTKLQAQGAAISPDGQRVACRVREHYDGQWRVALLSMRDGTIERDNLPLPAAPGSPIRWSPDGKALDYVDARDSANIWRFPLNGSGARPLTHLHAGQLNDFAWNRDGTRLAWVSSDIRHDVIVFHRGANP